MRVEWSTETEMNTAGFNLYRGESADGPFDVKANDQLIPPAADPLTGGKYQYVDKTAKSGVTYYYRLEEVERNGGTNNFGPISVNAGGLEGWHALVLVLLGIGAAAILDFRTESGPPRRDGRAGSRRRIRQVEALTRPLTHGTSLARHGLNPNLPTCLRPVASAAGRPGVDADHRVVVVRAGRAEHMIGVRAGQG